jgi:hypothetical protein
MFDTQGMLRSAASSLETSSLGVLAPDLLEQLRRAGSKDLLPVPQALAELFPERGVRRGSTITVSGSSSLVLALLAEVSQHQGWCAEVGLPLLGSAAAAEAGVELERFVRVAEPGEQWPSVVASLLEAFDIVVIHPPPRAREADMRRLSARARERSAVLLVAGDNDNLVAGDNDNKDAAHYTSAWPGTHYTSAWPGTQIGLTVIEQRWHGLGSGHGYLQAHEIEVQSLGRGAAIRPRRATVWLPQAL